MQDPGHLWSCFNRSWGTGNSGLEWLLSIDAQSSHRIVIGGGISNAGGPLFSYPLRTGSTYSG
jgi:hypothetical protein